MPHAKHSAVLPTHPARACGGRAVGSGGRQPGGAASSARDPFVDEQLHPALLDESRLHLMPGHGVRHQIEAELRKTPSGRAYCATRMRHSNICRSSFWIFVTAHSSPQKCCSCEDTTVRGSFPRG